MITPPPVVVDPLVEHRIRLAKEPADPALLIVIRAMGHRGEVSSQLHALELIGYAIRNGGQLS